MTLDRRRTDQPVPVERRKGGRRAAERIANLETHPDQCVGLSVAAAFLGLCDASVRARIEDGRIRDVVRDGNIYRIPIASLAEYQAALRRAS